jgi:tetratricopeptide (TPR) repeat protein
LTAAGDVTDVAGAMTDLAICLKDEGNLNEAAVLMTRALRLMSKSADTLSTRRAQAWALENLGSVLKRQARLGDALQAHISSFKQFSAIGEKAGQGFAARNVGDILLLSGYTAEAVIFYSESGKLFTTTGKRFGVAQARASEALGLWLSMKPYRAAVTFLQASRVAGGKYAWKFCKKRLDLRKANSASGIDPGVKEFMVEGGKPRSLE